MFIIASLVYTSPTKRKIGGAPPNLITNLTTFTCSKSKKETLEQYEIYVQS